MGFKIDCKHSTGEVPSALQNFHGALSTDEHGHDCCDDDPTNRKTFRIEFVEQHDFA